MCKTTQSKTTVKDPTPKAEVVRSSRIGSAIFLSAFDTAPGAALARAVIRESAMRAMLQGRAVWSGAELAAAGDWIFTLDAAQCAEIGAALAGVRGRPLFAFGRDDFPLPKTAPLLAAVLAELEGGRGCARLRGLPVENYSEDDLRQIFWGIGRHLGTAVYQNASGEIMGEVRDETRRAVQTFEPTEEGRVASARARSRASGPLRWHTDRCDVIALLCVRNAASGGVSKLASIPAIHNEILRLRPNLLELLCRDYWRMRPADEDGKDQQRAFAMPVFGFEAGHITSQYSRTYVEQAQEIDTVPRLTKPQNEALDLLAEAAEALCLHAPFVPGDIQLLNNHLIYHGRTGYTDDEATRQDRLLLRLWLAVPNSRPLPAGFDVLWGDTAPGALRGGVVQPATGLRVPS
jgi:hypothetical protein